MPPAASHMPNMVSNDDIVASPEDLSFDPSLFSDLPELDDLEMEDLDDLLRLFGVEAALDQA